MWSNPVLYNGICIVTMKGERGGKADGEGGRGGRVAGTIIVQAVPHLLNLHVALNNNESKAIDQTTHPKIASSSRGDCYVSKHTE